MLVRHLSYSSINTYLLCPRAWKYRYLDRIKMPVSAVLPFGSAMHSAIENYVRSCHIRVVNPQQTDTEKEAIKPVSDMFTESWTRQLAKEKEIAWKKGESAETFAELGRRMTDSEIEITGAGPSRKVRNLSVFLNDLEPMMETRKMSNPEQYGPYEPVIEKKVTLLVPGVEMPIIGYIDMIADDGVPVDFKTASRKWYAKKAHGELQPAFYLCSLLQSGMSSPDQRFRYIIITKTKKPVVQVIETKRTTGELFWTLDLIREVWESMNTGKFPPNPTGWKHNPNYCEYWELCHGESNV